MWSVFLNALNSLEIGYLSRLSESKSLITFFSHGNSVYRWGIMVFEFLAIAILIIL